MKKSFINRIYRAIKIDPDLYEEVEGRYSFKSSSIEKIIERVDLSLISLRETSRYLVGLLILY